MLLLISFVIINLHRILAKNITFCHLENVEISGKAQSDLPRNSCFGTIIFEEPVQIFTVSANPSRVCIRKSLCSGSWHCLPKIKFAQVQIISQPQIQSTIFYHKCRSQFLEKLLQSDDENGLKRFSNFTSNRNPFGVANQRSARGKREIAEFGAGVEALAQSVFLDQTKRMFYFLSNLNPESVQSPVRVVSLLEKTVELVTVLCDANFLSPMFMREVLRGFLFLLKEQGSEGITDLEESDFEELTQALDACAVTPASLTLLGVNCPPEIKVKAVSRLVNDEPQTVPYSASTYSFEWGKYDIVVDAIWYAVNIVHGACFATFRQNINLHHKYQVSMEEVFRGDILKRWRQPLNLVRNYEYDHILLAPVNQSMHVLDACTVGAYVSSPFKHRLQRPLTSKRKRRAVADSTIIRGHCLSRGEEKEGLKKWKALLC